MFGHKTQSLNKRTKPLYHFRIMPQEMRFRFHICQQVSKNSSVTKSNIIKSELLNEETQSLSTRMENLIRHIDTQSFSSIIISPIINGKNLSHVAHLIYQIFPYWGDRGSLIPAPPGKIPLQQTPSLSLPPNFYSLSTKS